MVLALDAAASEFYEDGSYVFKSLTAADAAATR